MKNALLLLCVIICSFSCVRDDVVDDRVDPVLRITNPIDSLSIDSSFQLKALYLDEVGAERNVTIKWETSNTTVLTVANSGVIRGEKQGNASVSARYFEGAVNVVDSIVIAVDSALVVHIISEEKTGTVQTTSSYPLSGNYTLKKVSGGIELSLASDYNADNSLPGLYIYLSNNNSTTEFAMEIGPVTVFSGAHTYFIPNVGINDYSYILYYCKPFNVKVGEGIIN